MRTWGLALLVASLLTTPVLAATTYVYDELGRITQVTYDNGRQITYSYDSAGNRTQVVTASGTNQPPLAVNYSGSTNENTPVTFDPRAADSDPDGDALTIAFAGTPAHGTVAINSGASLTYMPFTGYSGPDGFTYYISDGHSHTVSALVSLTVVNRAPTAVNDTGVTTTRNTAVTFDPRANDTDPDSDALTITATSTPSHGAVTINGGSTLSYTPVTSYTGTDNFTYTIDDGHGHPASATVTVTVNVGANNPPAASDFDMVITVVHAPPVPVTPQRSMNAIIHASDPDGDPLTVTGVTNGTNGTVTFTTTSVTYTYNSSVTGTLSATDNFTYTVSDGFGGSATATVTVDINVENNQ